MLGFNIIFSISFILMFAIGFTEGALAYAIVHRLLKKMTADCIRADFNERIPNGVKGCPVSFDSMFSCWPPTPPNTTVAVRCAYILFHEGYSTRRCNENGTWEVADTMTKCKFLPSAELRKRRNEVILGLFDDTATIKKVFEEEERGRMHKRNIWKINLVLRSADLAVCVLSLILITCFVPWKDRRFILHRFLILSFAIFDLLKILLLFSSNTVTRSGQKECTVEWILGMYFILVQVFMMFGEGFYHFRQFYYVFVVESRVQSYVIFAYVTPIFIVFCAYVPAFYFDPPSQSYACWDFFPYYKYNYIVYAPMFLILLLNLLITIYMMNLIITKLKREKNVTNQFAKARKGARGFLVLIFLLGFGYMVTLFGPEHWWFYYFKSIVQPTQGMLVCFLQVFFSNKIVGGCRKGKRRFVASMRIEREFNNKRASMFDSTAMGSKSQKRNNSKPDIHKSNTVDDTKHQQHHHQQQQQQKQHNQQYEKEQHQQQQQLEEQQKQQQSQEKQQQLQQQQQQQSQEKQQQLQQQSQQQQQQQQKPQLRDNTQSTEVKVLDPEIENAIDKIYFAASNSNAAYEMDDFQEFTSYEIQKEQQNQEKYELGEENLGFTTNVDDEDNVGKKLNVNEDEQSCTTADVQNDNVGSSTGNNAAETKQNDQTTLSEESPTKIEESTTEHD